MTIKNRWDVKIRRNLSPGIVTRYDIRVALVETEETVQADGEPPKTGLCRVTEMPWSITEREMALAVSPEALLSARIEKLLNSIEERREQRLADALQAKDEAERRAKALEDRLIFREEETDQLIKAAETRVEASKHEPISDYGEHMSLSDFAKACACEAFIDYDGSGYYATKTGMTRVPANPSDVALGDIDTHFTHVMWFNK